MATFCADKTPCKVMMFFHGGLNTHDDSVARAADLSEEIRRDGTFPLFLSWDSSLPAAWWDHVAHVHEGLWTGKSLVAASPYFATVDEVKGLSEAPSAWMAEIRHTFPSLIRNGETNSNAQSSYEEIRDHPEGISISQDLSFDRHHQARDDRHLSQVVAPIAVLPLTIWGKIVLPPRSSPTTPRLSNG